MTKNNKDNSENNGSDFDLYHSLDVIVRRQKSIIFFLVLSLITSIYYFFSTDDYLTSQITIKKITGDNTALFINLNSLDYDSIYEKPPYEFNPNNLLNRFISILSDKNLIEKNLKRYLNYNENQLISRTKNFVSSFEIESSQTNCHSSINRGEICDIENYKINFLISKNEVDEFPALINNLVDDAYNLFIISIIDELKNVKIQVEKKANYQIKALTNLLEIEEEKQIKLLNQDIKFLESQYYIAKELNIEQGSFHSVIGSSQVDVGEGEMSSEVFLQSFELPYYVKGYLVIEQEIKVLKDQLRSDINTAYMVDLQSKITNLVKIKSLIIEELSDEISRLNDTKSIINFDKKDIEYNYSNTKLVNSLLIVFIGFLIAITQAFLLNTIKQYINR